jgi:hypothetical protein
MSNSKSFVLRLLTAKALLSMHGLLTDRERRAIEQRIARKAKP